MEQFGRERAVGLRRGRYSRPSDGVARPNRCDRRIRQNGGSLFVVGDWTSPLQGHAEAQDISDPYGLHFNGESDKWLRNIQDPTNKTVEDYEWRVVLHNTGQHPIMNNVDTVEYDGVSLNVTDTDNGTQAPLLYGDSDTYEYTYSTTEKEYPRGERIVGAAATWDIGDNGRVVAFGSQKRSRRISPPSGGEPSKPIPTCSSSGR